MESVAHLAEQMVEMAVYYQFDGWLVNIENHINVSDLRITCIKHCLVKVSKKYIILIPCSFQSTRYYYQN